MIRRTTTHEQGTAGDSVQLSALRRIGLTDHELQLLPRQGFLRREVRCGRTVYRLRFRDGDRQRAVCVSKEDVAAVTSELAVLQDNTKSRRNLIRIARQANQKLKDHIALLNPILESCGYRRHGLQFRRRRARPSN